MSRPAHRGRTGPAVQAPRAVGVLALLVVLAGCADEAPSKEDLAPVATGDQLVGFVLDPALMPVPGAHVEVQGQGAEATTDEEGRYAFHGLPEGTPVVVVVAAEGFVSASKSLVLEPDTEARLDFALERVQVTEPYHETTVQQGFLSCSLVAKGPTGNSQVSCAAGPDERRWDLALEPSLAGVVVEVAWEAASEAARDLNLSVETVGFGDQDWLLAADEGPSILRAQVPQAAAQRYYAAQGGILRVAVDVGADVQDDETGSGGGVALQQDFQVFVTAFYHAPPPPGFTIA